VNNNPVRYNDPTGHFAFLLPMAVGAVIGAAVSVASYALVSNAQGRDMTWSGAAGAAAGGAVAGAICVIAPAIAGSAITAVAGSAAATGTTLSIGTALVNAVGGVSAYMASGGTQNAVDELQGNEPTWKPSVEGVVVSAATAGAFSIAADAALPVSSLVNNTIGRASTFMPGRTLHTLLATPNARNMYGQVLFTGWLGGVVSAEEAIYEEGHQGQLHLME
jgi:hypothetical protein